MGIEHLFPDIGGDGRPCAAPARPAAETSVGSLIGAIYAADLDSFDLEWTAFKLEKDDRFGYGVITAVMGTGAAKGDKLEEFVRSHVKVQNIEDLKLPFAAVATDLNWGTKVPLEAPPGAGHLTAAAVALQDHMNWAPL